MHESPRLRRLRNDLAAMERLRSESSVLRFRAPKSDGHVPPQHYIVEFRGKSLARERGKIAVQDRHEVEIKLGASYPRTMPELRWLTPIGRLAIDIGINLTPDELLGEPRFGPYFSIDPL